MALREAEATLELRVEVASYPRSAVEALTEEVQQSGGTLVELWRLPKPDRDAFRARSLTGPDTHELEDFEAAAIVLHGHLQQLAIREPLPEGPPLGPNTVPIAFFDQAARSQAPESSAAIPEPTASEETASEEAPAQEGTPEYETFDTLRRGRRFAVKLEMEFRTELDFVREHATNISNGGLFVRTAHRPPVDSVVTVQVRLPTGERLQGDALVVHVVDDPYKGGVGLAFLNDDPTFAETLDRYLASLASTPAS